MRLLICTPDSIACIGHYGLDDLLNLLIETDGENKRDKSAKEDSQMTLEGLLAVAGIVIAVYAVAQPVQRRSIGLFVPGWLVPGSLVLSASILLWREGARVYRCDFSPWSDLTLTVVSFALPIFATFLAIRQWHAARITKHKDGRFHGFILTCLHEERFDELVRIIEKNIERLAPTCRPETVELLFEPHFIQAMVQTRTWIHLRLLADNALLDLLPNHTHTAWRVLRELLFADNSPLRSSAIIDEGGDETLHYTDEEDRLIESTLRNPRWYHRCRAGYPLLIAACERIDSGDLDIAYNRVDARYGTHQGIATRTKCSVFLAEKTIAHALRISLKAGNASAEDTRADAADLYWLFMVMYDHSTYSPKTWHGPFRCGDYPTPFGFLLAEILSDYERICQEAWRQSANGAKRPADLVETVIRMWAYCIMLMVKDDGRVSPGLRLGRAISYLDLMLELRLNEVNASSDKESRGAWTDVLLTSLREAAESRGQKARDFLTQAANGLDICRGHVFKCDQWLRDELELPGRPRPEE